MKFEHYFHITACEKIIINNSTVRVNAEKMKFSTKRPRLSDIN